jgi:hypothetical protein
MREKALHEFLDCFEKYGDFLDAHDFSNSISDVGLVWDSSLGDLVMVLLANVYKVRLEVIQVIITLCTNHLLRRFTTSNTPIGVFYVRS